MHDHGRSLRSPEYFCSRPVRKVFLYKKALAVGKTKIEEEEYWEEWDAWQDGETAEQEGAGSTGGKRKRVITQMSDIELYERRTRYYFWPFGAAGTSPDFPARETPELQVADMSVFDFFRFVKYHGGQCVYVYVCACVCVCDCVRVWCVCVCVCVCLCVGWGGYPNLPQFAFRWHGSCGYVHRS